jgi:hypothetical protein
VKVLFVNHDLGVSCGVWQYGEHTREILQRSTKHDVHSINTHLAAECRDAARSIGAEVILYNYHPIIMPWASGMKDTLSAIHVGLYHDSVPKLVANDGPVFCDHWISINPEVECGPRWFKIGRPIPKVDVSDVVPKEMTFSSFGIFFAQKNYDKIARLIHREFPGSTYRLHAIRWFKADGKDHDSSEIAGYLRSIAPSLKIEVTTEMKTRDDMVRWLAESTLNILLYQSLPGAGPSSALDFCLAARRPVITTVSSQFDHVDLPTWPAKTFGQAIEGGTDRVNHYADLWSEENLLRDYEAILDRLAAEQ